MRSEILRPAFILFVLIFVSACSKGTRSVSRVSVEVVPAHPIYKSLPNGAPPELKQLIDGAVSQAGVTTGYDPAYVKLDYPGGDVPSNTGVCSDVIVRAFRKINIDLQQELHEDMTQHFAEYPRKWGLSTTDSNIDHRRVPNLMTYFARQGKSVPITNNADDYLPGDVVTWTLSGGSDHIGMVTNMWSESEKRCLIVHNIGAGTRVEDVLFAWPITGHYRYFALH